MSERNLRIMSWIAIAAGVALLAYVAITALLMVRGDLAVGPLRVVGAVMNAIAGGAILAVGVLVLRGRTPR